MAITIATWNINSVRLRIGLVGRFLEEQQPDVLCLQETKCHDGQFPLSDFRKFGYEHVVINGQKGYHGVAIVSRIPIRSTHNLFFCDNPDARHIAAELGDEGGGLTIHNFYVPAGGDEPDPVANPKFAHKLAFLDEMGAWLGGELSRGHAIVVGDLNVAPLENDVWSHKAMLKIVSHTPIETEKFEAAMLAGSWVDAMRRFTPAQERLFTWWSYRSANWEIADKGRRLDHVWASERLADSLRGLEVVKEARGWERPSDHVPVLVDIDH
jgi:exodeoxyribonuclease-3